LRKWEEDNHQVLLNNYPDIRHTDLWIILETWSTPSCEVMTWESEGHSLFVGFGVTATSVADASLNVGSFLAMSRGDPIKMEAPVCLVVFRIVPTYLPI
jgi:hypothetical protein